MIDAVLFFTLSYYGIFISFYYIKIFPYPDGNTQILDPFLDNKVEIFTPEDKVWKDIKNINKELTIFKHIKKTIVTDEPMIKTTTAKVKRFEEIKKILQGN